MASASRTDDLDAQVAVAARRLARQAGVAARELDSDPWLRDRPDREPVGLGSGPDALGRFHQELQARADRRSTGTFHTPVSVGRQLVDLGAERLGHLPASICDPACGGGALLLAAADHLLDAGVAAADAVYRLTGLDIDTTAVQVTRVSLALWRFRHGGGWAMPSSAAITAADPLLTARSDQPVDLVVMNPPFQGQLKSGTAHTDRRRDDLKSRWGDLIGAYTDTAALFLLLGDELAADTGVVAAIVPRSLLGARDSEQIRAELTTRRRLGALWLDPGPFEGASVKPAAVVLEAASNARPANAVEADARRSLADTGSRWSAGVADLPEVPTVVDHRPLGDRAEIIAGFRDEFYGLLDGIDETRSDTLPGLDERRPVVTSGLIDPLSLRWGVRPAKIGGQTFERPVLDEARIGGRALQWAQRQLRPKLLVANQTSVIEAVADPTGELVGITPVIAVMPHQSDDLDLLAALTCSPLWSALVARDAGGTGLGTRAVRVSPGRLAALPVPPPSADLDRAVVRATDLRRSVTRDGLTELGALLMRAHGMAADDPLLAWWASRWPRSLG